MNTLIIHPKDETTDFLKEIYVDMDCTIINTEVSKEYLRQEIELHHRIIMLGHGCESGLFGSNGFVIDKSFVDLLEQKECVYIWCNADVFVKLHKLKGFYTGMMISEFMEAFLYNVPSTSSIIAKSNKDFALAVKNSINSTSILSKAKFLYKGDEDVVKFNRDRMYYKPLIKENENRKVKQ